MNCPIGNTRLLFQIEHRLRLIEGNAAETKCPYAEKAVISSPRSFAAHTMLGRVLVEGDLDVPRGTHEIETAVELAPASLQARFALASAYAKAGRKEDAAKARAEFLRLKGQSQAAAPVQQ